MINARDASKGKQYAHVRRKFETIVNIADRAASGNDIYLKKISKKITRKNEFSRYPFLDLTNSIIGIARIPRLQILWRSPSRVFLYRKFDEKLNNRAVRVDMSYIKLEFFHRFAVDFLTRNFVRRNSPYVLRPNDRSDQITPPVSKLSSGWKYYRRAGRFSSLAQTVTSSSARNFERRSVDMQKGRGGGGGGWKEEARSGSGGCRSLGSAVVKLITPRNCLN